MSSLPPNRKGPSHTKFSLDDADNHPVSVDMMLAASQKLLAINQGLTEPDERDALWNKRILMPDKLFAEKIVLDAGGKLRNAVYKASRKRNLSYLTPGQLGEPMDSVLIGSPLSTPLEEINPLSVAEQAQRISHMGEGGLSSSEMISEEAQAVHPSIFGFLGIIEGPECHADIGDPVVYTRDGWKSWLDVDMDTQFGCYSGGYVTFQKPSKIVVEDYDGPIYVIQAAGRQMYVTPSHRVMCRTAQSIGWEMHHAAVLASRNWTEYRLPVPAVPPSSADGRARIAAKPVEQLHTIGYTGKVYCATVPAGNLLTAVRGQGGIWSGNSEKAGIDIRTAVGTRFGSDGKLYQQFKNSRTGNLEWVSPDMLAHKTLKLPD